MLRFEHGQGCGFGGRHGRPEAVGLRPVERPTRAATLAGCPGGRPRCHPSVRAPRRGFTEDGTEADMVACGGSTVAFRGLWSWPRPAPQRWSGPTKTDRSSNASTFDATVSPGTATDRGRPARGIDEVCYPWQRPPDHLTAQLGWAHRREERRGRHRARTGQNARRRNCPVAPGSSVDGRAGRKLWAILAARPTSENEPDSLRTCPGTRSMPTGWHQEQS